MMKRKASSTAPAYPGSGKLSDYRMDGSWMMNQMEKGYENCPRGVSVDKSDEGNKKFAKRIGSIAARILESVAGGAVVRVADDDDNVTVISAAWCRNRSGVCVSFAVPIDVMGTGELLEFGNLFKDTVMDAYGDMLKEMFISKTDDPLVSATHGGELIMLWSFQGENDESTLKSIRNHRIQEIDYE